MGKEAIVKKSLEDQVYTIYVQCRPVNKKIQVHCLLGIPRPAVLELSGCPSCGYI